MRINTAIINGKEVSYQMCGSTFDSYPEVHNKTYLGVGHRPGRVEELHFWTIQQTGFLDDFGWASSPTLISHDSLQSQLSMGQVSNVSLDAMSKILKEVELIRESPDETNLPDSIDEVGDSD